MIPAVLLGLAEGRLNRVLEDDPELIQRCSQLQGRCVEIHISDLDKSLYCYPGCWGMHLSVTNRQTVDASISGRSMALLNLALNEDKVSTSIAERVQFQGEVAVAQQLQKIFKQLNFDSEDQLAQIFGDPLAYFISNRLQHKRAWVKRSAESLSQTTIEFAQYEAQLTPSLTELEEFSTEVSQLRDAVERSAARLQRLLRRLPD